MDDPSEGDLPADRTANAVKSGHSPEILRHVRQQEATIHGLAEHLGLQFNIVSELGSTDSAFCGLFWDPKSTFIIVAFRGTSPTDFTEWTNNFTFHPQSAGAWLRGFGRGASIYCDHSQFLKTRRSSQRLPSKNISQKDLLEVHWQDSIRFVLVHFVGAYTCLIWIDRVHQGCDHRYRRGAAKRQALWHGHQSGSFSPLSHDLSLLMFRSGSLVTLWDVLWLQFSIPGLSTRIKFARQAALPEMRICSPLRLFANRILSLVIIHLNFDRQN